MNDRRKKVLTASILLFCVLICGCAPEVLHPAFLRGKRLAEQEKWDDAIDSFRDALKADPDDDKAKQALENANKKKISFHLDQAKSFLDEYESKGNYQLLDQATEEALTASSYGPEDASVKEALKSIEEITQKFEKKSLHDYGMGMKAARKKDWEEALRIFKDLYKQYPGYRDVKTKWLKKCDIGLRSSRKINEADELGRKKDWDNALKKYQEILEIDPESELASERIDAIKQKRKDNIVKESLSVAEDALAKGEWGVALEGYSAVLKEKPDHVEALDGARKVRAKFSKDIEKRSDRLIEEGKYPEAAIEIKRALNMSPDSAGLKDKLARVMNSAVGGHYKNAKRFINQDLWGNALLELDRVRNLDPKYRDVEELTGQVRGRLQEAGKLEVVVVSFTNLTGQEQLEDRFCATLISFMKGNSGKWVEVYSQTVERPKGFNELEMARVIQKSLRTRIYVFGEIHSYQVGQERTHEMARKKYVVARVVRRNFNYDRAMVESLVNQTALNPHGTKPDRVVKIFDEYKYPVYLVKKHAEMNVVALVVDADTGFVSKTFGEEQKFQVEDYLVEAFPAARLKPDPLNLPSDDVVLKKVFDKAIQGIVEEMPFIKNLSQFYIDMGKKFEEKDDPGRAVEEYMRAHTIDPESKIMDRILKLKKYD